MECFAGRPFLEYFARRAREEGTWALDAVQIGIWVAQERDEILDVDLADRLVEMAFAERESRVPALLRRLEIFLEGILRVQKNDLAARGRDVAHDAVAHVEGVDEDFFSERCDFLMVGAFGENDAEFLLAVCQFVFTDRLDAKQTLEQRV